MNKTMGYNIIFSYIKDIWNVIMKILSFFGHILMGIMGWIGNSFSLPYGKYAMFFTLIYGSLIMCLLLHIPYVKKLIARHGNTLYLTDKFSIGVVTHIFLLPSLAGVLLSFLYMIPISLFCGWLISKGYGLTETKMNFIFSINLILKWLSTRRINKIYRPHEDIWGMGMNECEWQGLMCSALWSWARVNGWIMIVAIVYTFVNFLYAHIARGKWYKFHYGACLYSIIGCSIMGYFLNFSV